jgi:hypothetical protein
MPRSCPRRTTDVVSPFYRSTNRAIGGRRDARGGHAPLTAGDPTWGGGGRNIAVRGFIAPARSFSAAGWEHSTRCSYEKVLVDFDIDCWERTVVAAAIRTPGVMIVIIAVVGVVVVVAGRTGVHESHSHCE